MNGANDISLRAGLCNNHIRMSCRPDLSLLYLGVSWLSLTGVLSAEEPRSAVQLQDRFHITHWTAEDGLPQNRVSALAQTPDGYLWVGTWFGLARFDGIRFVRFHSGNSPEFKKDPITALAVDRGDGALWIGTRQGLMRLKDRQFTRSADAQGLAQWDIARLTAAAGGGVWAQTDRKVVFYREGASAVVISHFGQGEACLAAWETEEQSLALAMLRRRVRVARDGTFTPWELPAGTPPELGPMGLLP